MRKTAKTVSQNSEFPGRGLKPAPPTYETGMLPHLVTTFGDFCSGRGLSLHHHAHIVSVLHTTSCPISTEDFSPVVRRPELDADLTAQSSTEMQKLWSLTSVFSSFRLGSYVSSVKCSTSTDKVQRNCHFPAPDRIKPVNCG
jgi:hypothetical protein